MSQIQLGQISNMEKALFEATNEAELIYDELEPEIFPMYKEIFEDDVPAISWIVEDIIAYIEEALEENPNLQRHIMLNPKIRINLLNDIEGILVAARIDMEENT